MEELVFEDLEPKAVPVQVGGKKYLLREADEPATCAYRNAKARTYRLVDGELVGLNEGVGDIIPLLVSQCLCQVDGQGKARLDTNGNAVKVPEHAVRKLHPIVVMALFKKAKDMSPWLDEVAKPDGEDPGKKAPNGTTGTSDSPANSASNSTS